jgi:hypothetical protein
MADYKTIQVYAPTNVSRRIEMQPEITDSNISMSKTCLILIKEALNARESEKANKKVKSKQ